MARKLTVWVIMAMCIVGISRGVYAFDRGTLKGRVIDGFGKPIPSATITIVSNGSKTNTLSDSNGTFSIGYSPGNIKLSFAREGYVPVYIPLSLDEGTDLSVDDITVWKIPPKGGLFIVGDGEYIEMRNAEYYSESGSKERRFYVKGNPTIVKGKNLRVIDFQTDNPLVVGKTLYRVDEKGSVGSILLYPSQKYVLNTEEDTFSKIADNVGLRKLNVPPGRYFYCTGEITIRSKNGFGFFFEISS